MSGLHRAGFSPRCKNGSSQGSPSISGLGCLHLPGKCLFLLSISPRPLLLSHQVHKNRAWGLFLLPGQVRGHRGLFRGRALLLLKPRSQLLLIHTAIQLREETAGLPSVYSFIHLVDIYLLSACYVPCPGVGAWSVTGSKPTEYLPRGVSSLAGALGRKQVNKNIIARGAACSEELPECCDQKRQRGLSSYCLSRPGERLVQLWKTGLAPERGIRNAC